MKSESENIHIRGIRFARGLVRTIKTALSSLAEDLEGRREWSKLRYVYAGKELALALEMVMGIIIGEVEGIDDDIAIAIKAALSRFGGGDG